MAVTVLGYASADRAVRVRELPAANATAVVERRLSRPWPRLGGCAPQIAAQLAAAGLPARCVTWVAEDAVGRSLMGQLRAAGADVGGVVVAGTRTPESYIVYDGAGRSACFYDPGDAHLPELTAPQRAVLAAADVLCLTVGPAAATRAALDLAAPRARVAWSVKADPDAYPPDLVARLLARAGVVAYAEGERAFLAERGGGRAPRPDALVIETQGARGVRWARAGEERHVPVEPVPAADTTGAGDAFLAGVLAALTREPDDADAAVRAGVQTSRALLRARAEEEVSP